MSPLYNRIFLLVLSALAFFPLAVNAQTQSANTHDACAQYKKADQALHATYAKVLKDYAKDPQFLARLKQAQRAWIAFREAHLAARFPKPDKQAEYGSSYLMCRCTVLSELTEHREKELKTWADGIPEGDVCNGSVKTARVNVKGCQRTGTSLRAVEESTQKQAYLRR